MRAYLDLLNDIIENGHLHEDRTGVGRISVFGRMIRFNLKEGFPLVTSRKIFTKALIEEMLWFIKGDTNVNNLNANGVKIWDNWTLRKEHVDGIREKISNTEANYWLLASMEGMAEKAVDTIGPMYGYVWRHSLSGVDQLEQLIKNLKEKPYSSRHVVTAWVPELIPDENMSPQENIMMGRGALAPCHMMFQCFVKQPKDGGKPELSVLMYQR